MNETTTTLSDLSEDEQTFADVLIHIIQGIYNEYARKGEDVKLADISFGIKRPEDRDRFESPIGIPPLQEIAKRQRKSGENWKVTTQRMLDLFKNNDEIVEYLDGVYRLHTDGCLYKYLTAE